MIFRRCEDIMLKWDQIKNQR